MAWEKVRLGDVCKYVTSGGTPLASRADFYNPGTIPWLKTKEVNYSRITETENYISELGLANSSAKLIPADSVIVAMYGQGDTAGRVAINKIPLCTNQACCNLVIDEKKADFEFIYYNLCTLYNKLVSLKNGGAQPNLNAGLIKNLEISVPSLKTQKRIADILSAYDNLIENNQKQIKLLEEAAQRLYKQWFIDLKFPGHETTKIVDGLPEGWKYRNVSDFGSVITGKTPSTSKKDFYGGDIPFVTIPDMHGNVFSFETEKYLTSMGADSQKTKFLPKNAVMVSCIATVGLVNIVAKECQTNQQINSVILKEETDVYFFYESMLLMKSLLDGVGSNGATMTNVNKSKFENVRVLYPTKNLVMKFHEFTHPLFLKILSLSKSIHELKLIRDRLLPKLMSGEIEV